MYSFIVFLNYEPERLRDLPLHTTWQIFEDENPEILLTKKLEIHIIMLNKEAQTPDDNRLKKWVAFFKNPYGEEIRKMAEQDKEIKEALEGLYDINADEQKVLLAELRMKHILDRNTELKHNTIQIAKKLKEKNVDIQVIIDATGLTKEEIEKI